MSSPPEPAIEFGTVIKDGLRTIRFGMQQGGERLKDIGAPVPGPLATTVEQLASRADRTALRVGRASSRLARRVLFGMSDHPVLPSPLGPWLTENHRSASETAADFACAAYTAIKTHLAANGADAVLIYERALQAAFREVAREPFEPSAYPRLLASLVRHRPVSEIHLRFDAEPPRPLRQDCNRYCSATLVLAMAASEHDGGTVDTAELMDAAGRMVEVLWEDIADADISGFDDFIERYADNL